MKRSFCLRTLFLALGLSVFSWSSPVRALDGLYLGGQVGFVGLTGDYSNNYNSNLGYGVDLGFKTNSLIDLVLGFQLNTQANLNMYMGLLSADVHIAQLADFDFTVGAGPGVYFFTPKNNSAETKFGLNFGGAVDLIVDDHLKVGVGARYHAVFGSDLYSGSFYTVMARFGYLFDL